MSEPTYITDIDSLGELLGAALPPKPVRNKCITVKQPWASLIMKGVKQIENRSWSTKHRGRLWIHAGLQFDDSWATTLDQDTAEQARRVLDWEFLPHGAVLGFVDLVDVVANAPGRFAQSDMYHWVLENPFYLAEGPIRMRGKQGLWTLPDNWRKVRGTS